MAETKFWLALLLVSVGVSGCLADFDDWMYGVEFIYHAEHGLFLAVNVETDSCYFSKVDDSTKRFFETCHRNFLEMEVYDRIMEEDPNILVTSLEEMRRKYNDLLADYRCTGKHIFEMNNIFGSNYIKQCQGLNQAEIGK
ncbi:uncharacterized protein LOC143285901 [Babylonia areolata]|uniref:uncharacterized protein LOC143285901 n=1 Tax=Babylonia areolata TaxID=304850 RepID=UPI003FD23B51